MPWRSRQGGGSQPDVWGKNDIVRSRSCGEGGLAAAVPSARRKRLADRPVGDRILAAQRSVRQRPFPTPDSAAWNPALRTRCRSENSGGNAISDNGRVGGSTRQSPPLGSTRVRPVARLISGSHRPGRALPASRWIQPGKIRLLMGFRVPRALRSGYCLYDRPGLMPGRSSVFTVCNRHFLQPISGSGSRSPGRLTISEIGGLPEACAMPDCNMGEVAALPPGCGRWGSPLSPGDPTSGPSPAVIL